MSVAKTCETNGHLYRSMSTKCVFCGFDPGVFIDGTKSAAQHRLKVWPEQYRDILSGLKTFEVRLNDRNFKAGDLLHLEEFMPATQEYTGRKICKWVPYILPGGQFGVDPNYVIMAISDVYIPSGSAV